MANAHSLTGVAAAQTLPNATGFFYPSPRFGRQGKLQNSFTLVRHPKRWNTDSSCAYTFHSDAQLEEIEKELRYGITGR
jgi:hypothetical protein